MDKTSKTIGILSGIIIFSLFVYMGIQNRRINRLNDENQLQAVELSTLKDSVSVYQNKAGELTYKLSVVEVSHSNLKESLNKAGFEIKQLKEREINWRKVNNALKLELEAVGHGEASLRDSFYIMNTDTIQYSTFAWTNDYLNFKGSVENNNLFFDYKYNTGLSIIQESKRKETIVSVFLTDPKAKITSANSITVKHENKWYERPVIAGIAGILAGILISK
ncbi:MAG TPA: hypothetical protein DHV48_03585 [Prolixibacteraceae bacterium]|nr:hypothetical protein [Prolixibacteraceae bacterium]